MSPSNNASVLRTIAAVYKSNGFPHISALANSSADEIESLRHDLYACRNELCLQCGSYKFAHQGACDDCRWKDVGE